MDAKEIKSFYNYMQSQQTAQTYLYHCYKKINGIDAEAKSYENCNVFMYYLQHGCKFYVNGKKLDTLFKPILFFYGMIHLLKACLLTKRPNYPESTSILAHGASTRKRKKKQYTFMDDEVKVQHKGLFPYFSEHLFSIKNVSFEKIKMERLLSLIPELSLLFHFQKQEKMVKVGMLGTMEVKFPTVLLDYYHLTANTFIDRIQSHLPSISHKKVDQHTIYLTLERPIMKTDGPFFSHLDQSIYFPAVRENFFTISEAMVHYLILYNLSMLSRYEAEWWGELIATRPDIDYPFIVQFLEVTAEKVPLILGNELHRQFNI